MLSLQNNLLSVIEEIPNFPKEGILFKDISKIFYYPDLVKDTVDALVRDFPATSVDAILGIESRGFLFGILMAQKLGVPFVMARKKGKLPGKTISASYALEYGVAEIEVQIDSISEGMNVLIHDDLLATGGTAAAAAKLVNSLNGNVCGFSFLANLGALNGQELLKSYDKKIFNILTF